MTATTAPCPCGTSKSYASCCQPYHKGDKWPETAEKLMRARYSAYVKREIDFVGASHAPEARGDFDPKAAQQWSETADWQGLEVKATEAGLENDSEGTVEFIARFKVEKDEHAHHERAFFRKEESDGKWYYVDGKTVKEPIKRDAPKIGRNDPCTCGSGKKFKKCCG